MARKTNIILLILSLLMTITAHAELAQAVSQDTILKLLDSQPQRFANLEHLWLGDQLVLPGIQKQDMEQPYALTLPNGLVLSYGQILMLAGDFFGHPKYPISNCSEKLQPYCFKLQFATLAETGKPGDKRCDSPYVLTERVMTYLKAVEHDMQSALEEGMSKEEYYQKNGSEMNKKLNRVTCGGSIISDYIPFGTYLKLAQVNFDHFAPDAITAYKAGHVFAMKTAHEGYELNRSGQPLKAQKKLTLAYAQNAFASHYLSDAFASGHLRTPRRQLYQNINLPAVLILLTANIMHNEDNRMGLEVVNQRGMAWKAYGDGHLDRQDAATHIDMVKRALQTSVHEIANVYDTGTMNNDFPELTYFVDLEKIEALNQSQPLFKWDNGQLLKRKDINDPYSQEYTDRWSALMTLLTFYTKK